MDICEKVAYIKGLAEGLSLDESTKEGKILAAVIDVLMSLWNSLTRLTRIFPMLKTLFTAMTIVIAAMMTATAVTMTRSFMK